MSEGEGKEGFKDELGRRTSGRITRWRGMIGTDRYRRIIEVEIKERKR